MLHVNTQCQKTRYLELEREEEIKSWFFPSNFIQDMKNNNAEDNRRDEYLPETLIKQTYIFIIFFF